MRHRSTLKLLTTLVLTIGWSLGHASTEITVDPPADLHIIDPGHLGHLQIRWKTPPSLENLTDCLVRFQLQYFNTYENGWRTIRTSRLSYDAQFDLEKEARVRVSSLLRGPCANSAEAQSPPVEAVLQPPFKGKGWRGLISGFSCVFYQREFLECIWEKGYCASPQCQYYLFYWYKGLEQAVECPSYLSWDGIRNGCNISWDSLQEFTEFNVCVNVSSEEGPVRPAYFSLQIQNLVKPAAIETLSMKLLPNRDILLGWAPSLGRIAEACLEFEVESRQKDGVGEQLQKHLSRETTYTVSITDQSKETCFRVRSKVHRFCADRSFWSEWGPLHCLPGMTVTAKPLMEPVLVCASAIAIVTVITLALCLHRCSMWKTSGGVKGGLFLPIGPKGNSICMCQPNL